MSNNVAHAQHYLTTYLGSKPYSLSYSLGLGLGFSLFSFFPLFFHVYIVYYTIAKLCNMDQIRQKSKADSIVRKLV